MAMREYLADVGVLCSDVVAELALSCDEIDHVDFLMVDIEGKIALVIP
jgi:hypothetical protein